MQIAGPNLIAAQAAQPAARAKAPAAAPPPKPIDAAGFEALLFAKARQAGPAQAPAFGQPSRVGARLDITV